MVLTVFLGVLFLWVFLRSGIAVFFCLSCFCGVFFVDSDSPFEGVHLYDWIYERDPQEHGKCEMARS